MLFKRNRSGEPTARKTRFTPLKQLAAAAAVIGLVLTGAGAAAHAASAKQTCKDVLLVAYIESQRTKIASVPFRVRPCSNDSPGSWASAVGGATTNANGDNIGWVLQGMDVRLEGVGQNNKRSASARYKGVAKLTQKTPNVPLVPVAPVSLRSITLAITFTVQHQKDGGKSKNVQLPNLIKVTGTWSSHPDWAKFTYKKGGIVV
ncbi:hypothetical protein ABT297_30120 [Dactylosporangium sp. NPDC000555]|uniref:hypothetical protein n=1 Tax=Dactylosporangium sp. NPDC000555 TaxID=3154260 RepID=UPI00331C915F